MLGRRCSKHLRTIKLFDPAALAAPATAGADQAAIVRPDNTVGRWVRQGMTRMPDGYVDEVYYRS
jgi:hypothetical protein